MSSATPEEMPSVNFDWQLEMARSLFRIKDYTAGLSLLSEIVRKRPGTFDAWMLLTDVNLSLQHHEAALAAASAATQLRPKDTNAQYALGRVNKALGRLANATECYLRAIELDPQNANALTSLAILYRGRGLTDSAIELYQRALVADPKHLEARHNLNNALKGSSGSTASIATAELLVQEGPPAATSQRQSAIRLIENGEFEQALLALHEAMRIEPRAADLWLVAGTLALELAQPPPQVLPYFEEAVRLDRTCSVAAEMAYALCFVGGLADLTVHYGQLLDQTSPSRERLMLRKWFLPAIFDSITSLRASRDLYEEGLQDALRGEYRLKKAPDSPLAGGFFLAYHGENDRDLQIKAAKAWLALIPDLDLTAAHCQSPTRRGGKIRVGFISKFFAAHSIGNTSRGLIEKVSREHFEIFAIRITPSPDDEVTRLICQSADHEIVLDRQLFRAREQIAALELDVLFYQDIGLEPFSYFMAFARLAHVQCVSFGHPNTTGIPNIDYFVSNDLYENAEAQAHYSEKLFLLRDLPTLAYYYKPVRTAYSVDRCSLGLPADATLYVCPQSLFKFHPEFDVIINGILSRDTRGVLVLITQNFEHWTHLLRRRFNHTIPDVTERILFLPNMSRSVFLELLANADVVLDTIHFNGMNSSLECFAIGAPLVTMPTKLQRGRHTQAMYQKMGILDAIARTPEEYVDIATRLGTDRDYAGHLRSRILGSCDVLFENQNVISEFERFFRESLQERGLLRP